MASTVLTSTAIWHYTAVALVAAAAVIAVTFLVAWRALGRKQHCLSWSLAFFAAALQWTLYAAGPLSTDTTTHCLAVNALAIVVLTLVLTGHQQRARSQRLPANLWPYTFAVFATLVYLTVSVQHAGALAAFVPFIGAMAMFMVAALIVSHRRAVRDAERLAAMLAFVCGIALLGAAWTGFGQGADGNVGNQDLYLQWVVFGVAFAYIAMPMATLLMVASDLSEELKELAVRDNLTGLLNRRGLGEYATQAYATARRTGRPVTAIVSDIDHFKSINDDYGHTVGDHALTKYANLLTSNRRAEDIVARMGGEEFLIVLPGK
jgi:predicted signal transduction protein with EAL and GGDEF domain